MISPSVGGHGLHGGRPAHDPGLDVGQGPVEGHVAVVVDVVGLIAVASARPDGGGAGEPVEAGRGVVAAAEAAVHGRAAVAVGAGRGEGGAVLRHHVGRHVGHWRVFRACSKRGQLAGWRRQVIRVKMVRICA